MQETEPETLQRKVTVSTTQSHTTQGKTVRDKAEVAATGDPLSNNEQKLLKECTEDELLERASQLEDDALAELYDRYELKIYNYIYRRTSDPTLSEDLTAQVFLKMLEAIHNGRAWHSSFSGWLYRIAHNLVIDHYRVRDRQKSVSLDETPNMIDPDDNPVEAAEVRLDAEYLQAAIRRLTDDQAQVISLRFLEGYSFGEIADMMDKTEGAVKALQHRAVATLRQIMVFE
jgi:RNA polymerase sigma-70 factor (ECF subfamily)